MNIACEPDCSYISPAAEITALPGNSCGASEEIIIHLHRLRMQLSLPSLTVSMDAG